MRNPLRTTTLAILMLGLALVCGTTPTFAQGRTTASDETETQRRARIRLDLATAYFSEGKFTTALDEIKQALVASPDMPQALNVRGLIYAALGDDGPAEASFNRALQLVPADADVLHNYAWFLCLRKRYPESEGMFERAAAVPGHRGLSRTLLAKGVCEARSGQLELAEATLKRSYELDAGNPATAMNLADVLRRRGEFERARFYVRRVNDNLELRNAESLWLAVRIEHKMGNQSAVRSLGDQLRSSYPESPEAKAFERGGFDE